MTEPTIDVVVFDIGGVLLDWNPNYLYADLIPDDDQRRHFLTAITTPDWNMQQDAGRPWAEAVEELTALHPEHAEWIAAYDTGWLKMVKGLLPGTPDLLKELQELGVPTYALTNFSGEKWEIAKETFPILDSFTGEIVSGHEQVVKPDEKIYRLLVDRFALDATRTFFTDDVQRNIDGARAAGLQAELFTSADTLRDKLRDRGLALKP
ncbi:HAD family phosphatase [Kribbella sp. NPDC051770]|uniref:HAD family hydrolase n=1 Tax=Kribbella sp. NPDC051770 TaxID=3155413 RepID=UPI003442C91C